MLICRQYSLAKGRVATASNSARDLRLQSDSIEDVFVKRGGEMCLQQSCRKFTNQFRVSVESAARMSSVNCPIASAASRAPLVAPPSSPVCI